MRKKAAELGHGTNGSDVTRVATADPRLMLRHLTTELDLSIDEIARAIGTDPGTADLWLAGQSLPTTEIQARLTALLELYQHIRDTFTTAAAAQRWLHAPQRYLRAATPADVIRDGHVERVENALEALDSGIFI